MTQKGIKVIIYIRDYCIRSYLGLWGVYLNAIKLAIFTEVYKYPRETLNRETAVNTEERFVLLQLP